MNKALPSSWDTPLIGRDRRTVKAYGYQTTVRLRTDPQSDPLMDEDLIDEITTAIMEVYYTHDDGTPSLREDIEPPRLLAKVEYDEHTNFQIHPEIEPGSQG